MVAGLSRNDLAPELRARREWIAEVQEMLARGELEPDVAREMEEAVREPEWLFLLFVEQGRLAAVDDLNPDQLRRLGEVNAQIDAWRGASGPEEES